MQVRYDITHTTVYRYSKPVRFGQHRVMFRPRDSHDLRVLATDLQVSPEATVRMIQDPQSNSLALVQPLVDATELRIVCSFTIEYVPAPENVLELEPAAEYMPFAYSVQDRLDLEHYLRPYYDDPDGVLIRWAQQFLFNDAPNATREVLARMNAHIGQTLEYAVRHEEGTQTPLETLKRGCGTCRDYALLMMEAARRLGVATRFVSGYLYDAALDSNADGGIAMTGSAATHAWLQAYLPGAGWVAYDPTNNLSNTSAQLIRVGVARDPSQAAPISGSWFGEPNSYKGMEVQVSVRREGD
ncbi:MAG TPA: transglutaminase family protein [Burkholderiaceae bacterium]